MMMGGGVHMQMDDPDCEGELVHEVIFFYARHAK